uniref:RNA helicase n=2 Tax=Amphimedon queenslandica TaxID=400682 RepID=A0A1X7TF89_AMPQE
MDGKDVVAMARTGSGKTAAFLIPLFERLKSHSPQVSGVRGLILSPTRELALQTMKFTKELGRFTGLRAAVILGGDRIEDQFSTMHENPDIIIATPGRFLHLLLEMDMKLLHVEYVVFDEADRLFEMGFSEQLHEIIHKLPEQRQTLLFSATLPKMLVDFAKAGLTDPVLIRLDVDSKLSNQLSLSFLSCRSDDKTAVLLYLLRSVIPPNQQSVIFVATKHHVEYLKEILSSAGIDSSYVYGSLDQTARKISIGKFLYKKTNVLLVTDIAARGIDIPLLDNVINYHFPSKAKLFVHRVGRVARAGRTGTAYSLVSPDEGAYVVDLHLFLGRNIITESRAKCDGVYGSVPHIAIEDEDELLIKLHNNNEELVSLRKVAENGMKHYIKSRNLSSPESIRRAKELANSLHPHPLFGSHCLTAQVERGELLSALKTYKPSQTIFEVNSTTKGVAKKVMLSKRAKYDQVVMTLREKSNQRKKEEEKEEEREKGEERRDKSVTAPQPYINYKPSDHHTEKGLSIDHFEEAASSAVLDLTGDENNDMQKAKRIRKWDRKRKRFVTESGKESSTKKIKTESGRWISSTYKTGLYQTWKTKNKVEGNSMDSETPPARFARRKGRFNPRQSTGGAGGTGRRVKSEIKSVNEILRKRQKINFMKERRQINKRKGARKSVRGGATTTGGRGKRTMGGRGRKPRGKRN